jgi:hypothetical protein
VKKQGYWATKWRQLWCSHDDMIQGIMNGQIWTHCNKCSRRTGPAKRISPDKIPQPHWKNPNFGP